MQKTNFKYKILIHDAYADGTADIMMEQIVIQNLL